MSGIGKLTTPVQPELSISRLLEEAEDLIDRFAPVIAVFLVSLSSLWAWFASRGTRLEFDELLEISAATAPTNRQVVSFLAAGIDYNPPLSHFLVRAAVSLFGETELAFRLPALLGMTVLLVCLYIFVSRWLSRSYGVLAMLTAMCLPVRIYAAQARPYGLVLGFSALAVVLYQQVIDRRKRKLSLVLLAACSGCLAATHYYAILAVGPILLAEVLRSWKSRRADWALLTCSIGPPMIALLALRNVIGQQRGQLTHYFARGNILSFDHGYDMLAMDPLVYCVALIPIVWLLWRHSAATEAPVTVHFWSNVRPLESHVGLGLLLLPIFGAFCTQFVTHAYLTRYFLPAAIGFSICVCYGARGFSRILPGIVVVLILSLGLGFGKALLQQVSQPAEAPPPGAALNNVSGPILFDSPGPYLQVYHYFPALRKNIWVIADPVASLKYRQYDTDDKIMLALAAQGRAQTTSLAAAVHRWQTFDLIPRSADYVWALKCVLDAGAQVKIKSAFGSSNFVFGVTVPPGTAVRISACSRPT